MKWDDFTKSVADLPLFDLATVAQLSGEPKVQVSGQLWRWAKAGKVISLRRGVYALAEPYRRARLSPLHVANVIYTPSYLSCRWALSLYGLIPDAVPTYGSVTTRVTRTFRNSIGTFQYYNVKSDLFWGVQTREVDGLQVAMAEPEKALLDTWHLARGEWTPERLEEMRIQQADLLDRSKLMAYVRRWDSPRIARAGQRLAQLLGWQSEERE